MSVLMFPNSPAPSGWPSPTMASRDTLPIGRIAQPELAGAGIRHAEVHIAYAGPAQLGAGTGDEILQPLLQDVIDLHFEQQMRPRPGDRGRG